jgi:hypothetical protein
MEYEDHQQTLLHGLDNDRREWRECNEVFWDLITKSRSDTGYVLFPGTAKGGINEMKESGDWPEGELTLKYTSPIHQTSALSLYW